jgi:hypothetical protein
MIVFRKHLKMDISLKFVRFHNAAMIALALIVLVGTLVGAYQRTLDPRLGGVAGLFCPPQGLASDELMTGTLGFFIYIFYLSKYVELIDTFILIAKGKDLLFLHCYHHCSMLFVTWSWFAFPWLEGAWWCAVVNSIIHSFMYYYYLRTAVPGTKIWWGKYLTSAQIFQVVFLPCTFALCPVLLHLSPILCSYICHLSCACTFVTVGHCNDSFLQFFTGMVVVAYAFYLGNCSGDKRTAMFSTAVNVSFFGLFIAFFFKRYDSDGSKSPRVRKEDKAK